ncbi:ATP-binding protein [Methylobacterium sp. ID0610]|uniref:ATP-binding protein n=1 Tax=Methylobacterium carpenticola TaxID=3344827 RepID=UPI0036BEDDFA
MTTLTPPDGQARSPAGGAGLRGALAARVMIRRQDDILTARQAGREAARGLGLGTADQTRLATAISELVRNALRYAGGGQCRIFTHTTGSEQAILIEVEDDGPGIDNVAAALMPGYSTGGSLGLGLPAVQKLMDDVSFETRPGFTRITARMARRR